VRDAFHYYDPKQPPDRALFARVLLPVTYNGGGQSSIWRTEITAVSGLFHLVPLFGTAARVGDEPVSLVPGVPNDDRGVFVHPLRQLAENLQFSAVVREVSRDPDAAGAQLPIVRERDFGTRDIDFPSVPMGSRVRATLRVYLLDAPSATCKASLIVAGEPLPVSVTATASRDRDDRPAFAIFNDLGSRLTRGEVTPARYHVRVNAVGPEGPVRFWAFITITDNETQQVTILSPQ
jgi:hypothetical protein